MYKCNWDHKSWAIFKTAFRSIMPSLTSMMLNQFLCVTWLVPTWRVWTTEGSIFCQNDFEISIILHTKLQNTWKLLHESYNLLLCCFYGPFWSLTAPGGNKLSYKNDFCIPKMKERKTWNHVKATKGWCDFHFWLNFKFKVVKVIDKM